MRIYHISDTHCQHSLLNVPKDIDIIIHSGDESNSRSPYINYKECMDFLEWYGSLNIKYKVFIAGNHSTAIEKRLVSKETIESFGITYLENESVTIDGLKIWGSPHTPQFCNWAFMKARDKLHDVWQAIPDDTDVVVVHGPPKGILDLSYNRENILEHCGCKALFKRTTSLPNLKAVLSGHIHNCQDIINAGTRVLAGSNTIYSNGSVVTDGKFGTLSSNGNILEL